MGRNRFSAYKSKQAVICDDSADGFGFHAGHVYQCMQIVFKPSRSFVMVHLVRVLELRKNVNGRFERRQSVSDMVSDINCTVAVCVILRKCANGVWVHDWEAFGEYLHVPLTEFGCEVVLDERGCVDRVAVSNGGEAMLPNVVLDASHFVQDPCNLRVSNGDIFECVDDLSVSVLKAELQKRGVDAEQPGRAGALEAVKRCLVYDWLSLNSSLWHPDSEEELSAAYGAIEAAVDGVGQEEDAQEPDAALADEVDADGREEDEGNTNMLFACNLPLGVSGVRVLRSGRLSKPRKVYDPSM